MRFRLPTALLLMACVSAWAANGTWVSEEDLKRLTELKKAPQARSGLEAPAYGYADIKKTIEDQRAEFDALVEREILPKLAADIKVILAEGWAEAVSPKDLFHVHLLLPKEGLTVDSSWHVGILKLSDYRFLYHTHEYDDKQIPPSRSVLSTGDGPPRALPGDRVVRFNDLSAFSNCQVNFATTKEKLEVSYGFQAKRSRDGYFWGWNCNL